MSKARNLADLLDSNGDVVSGALDNVPPSNDASALTTGTLPIARIADGSITTAKLASTLDLSGKTVTLPSGTGGKLVNMAHARHDFTGDVGTSSTSFVEIATNIRITYTPLSASNTLRITLYSPDVYTTSTGFIAIQAMDISGPTAISPSQGSYGSLSGGVNVRRPHTHQFLVPAWSGAKTISGFMRTNGGTQYVNYMGGDGFLLLIIEEFAL
jgi:hypothetical protein